MLHSEVREDAKYRIQHPKVPATDVFTVVKINPKNIKLRKVGSGSIVNASPVFLRPADEADVANAESAAPVFPEYTPQLTEGTVVRSSSSKVKGLHVVIKVNQATVSIAPLGGKSLGWRVNPASLTVVDLFSAPYELQA